MRYLYEEVGFTGRMSLLYGARTGLDAAHPNDEWNDFAQYCDRPTFAAFKARSHHPEQSEDIDWRTTVACLRLIRMMGEPNTYV